jgi:type IV pilus assembly protein PilY1
MGWKIDLNLEFPGERAIRNLLIKEGVLFGSTIIPQSNQACMNGPGGYLFSIDALTGGSVVGGPSFDLNNDGKFDELDVVEVAGTGTDYQDYAAAIRIEGGLPSDIAVIDGGKNDGSKVCYQTSTGDLVCTTVNVGSSYPEGRLSWKELSY